MKLSIEQVNEYLRTLGVDAEVVTDEKDIAKDFKADELVQTTNDTIKEVVRADIEAETIDAKLPAEIGKTMGTLRSAIARAFGGTNKEYEGMEIKDIVAKAKEKYNEVNGRVQNDWEQEKASMVEEHEKLIEALKTEYDDKLAESNNKYIQRDIDAYFLTLAQSQAVKSGDITEHADTLQYKARKQYDVKWNDEKKVVEFWKDGRVAMNGNKPIDHKEFAKDIFTKNGVLATGTQHLSPKDVKEHNLSSGIIKDDQQGIRLDQSNLREQLQDAV